MKKKTFSKAVSLKECRKLTKHIKGTIGELIEGIDQAKKEQDVIKAAINWYNAAPTEPCQYGKKCQKHAKVCQLEFAVRELLKAKK